MHFAISDFAEDLSRIRTVHCRIRGSAICVPFQDITDDVVEAAHLLDKVYVAVRQRVSHAPTTQAAVEQLMKEVEGN